MNSYIAQYLPQFGSFYGPYTSDTDEIAKIEQIIVFNPGLAKGETDDELKKQILCRIAIKDEEIGGILKSVGLIQGVASFSSAFSSDSMSTMKSDRHTIVVHEAEPGFFIAVFLRFESQGQGAMETQLRKLLLQAHEKFVLLNGSLQGLLNYPSDVVADILRKFWSMFSKCFNEGPLASPAAQWPNSLNYRGFMGMLPGDGLYRRSYKYLSQRKRLEFDSSVENIDLDLPKGIIVTNFDKSKPKNYGALYMNGGFDKSKNVIKDSSLRDLYNLLEYFDYHDQLTTECLVGNRAYVVPITKTQEPAVTNEHAPDPSSQAPSPSTPSEEQTSEPTSYTRTAVDMLNPVNLTNNLVISPLNYSMNSVMSLGRATTAMVPEEGWLSSFYRSTPSQVQEEEDSESEAEDFGEFILGPRDTTIERKFVYLKQECTETSETSTPTGPLEHSIVLFKIKQYVICLIYDSAQTKLDDFNFHFSLRDSLMIPIVEQLESDMGASFLGGSISSLRSLNNILRENEKMELDSNFFYIIHDRKDNWIKSSLPYLPFPSNDHIQYRNAVFTLHDYLTQILIVKGQNFFQETSLDEFFHKFNFNRMNDWMIYYLVRNGKSIVILKNQNHKKKIRVKIPEPPPEPEGPENTSGFLNSITGVLPLGFLDNLGDDVKSWIENVEKE